jgi:hypothetical protein
MRRPNSGRLEKEPSAGASSDGKIDGANVCVLCACERVPRGPTLEVITVSVAVYPTISVKWHHSGNFLTAHRRYHAGTSTVNYWTWEPGIKRYTLFTEVCTVVTFVSGIVDEARQAYAASVTFVTSLLYQFVTNGCCWHKPIGIYEKKYVFKKKT